MEHYYKSTLISTCESPSDFSPFPWCNFSTWQYETVLVTALRLHIDQASPLVKSLTSIILHIGLGSCFLWCLQRLFRVLQPQMMSRPEIPHTSQHDPETVYSRGYQSPDTVILLRAYRYLLSTLSAPILVGQLSVANSQPCFAPHDLENRTGIFRIIGPQSPSIADIHLNKYKLIHNGLRYNTDPHTLRHYSGRRKSKLLRTYVVRRMRIDVNPLVCCSIISTSLTQYKQGFVFMGNFVASHPLINNLAHSVISLKDGVNYSVIYSCSKGRYYVYFFWI